jgi:thiosulfate reductase cytochrome b subunit
MLLGMAVLIGWISLGLSSQLHEVFPALLTSCAIYWLNSNRQRL